MSDTVQDESWWSTYFDEVFLRIYRPLLDPEKTAIEVEAIDELLGLPPGSRVLDVGCGWGRHVVEMASRGFKTTGVDFSTVLLQEAERAAKDRDVAVSLVCGDMRKLSFKGEFEAAVSLFSSLGYFLDDQGDSDVLAGMRRAVVPNGKLLLETMHRDMISREYVERDWWETPDGDRIWVERSFDAVAGVSEELLRWRDASGAEGLKPHSIRIRSATEWNELLESSGWHPIEWIGGWDLEPFTHLSDRLIIVAEAV